MAAVRRQALAAVAVVIAIAIAAMGGPAVAQTPGPLRLEPAGPPGGLRIVNDGPAPVAIQLAIAVQKQEASGWVPIVTEFNAVARCDKPSAETTVSIAPSSTLVVQPWRGFSCSGQCNLTCRANIYYGSGMFRFVATTVSPPSEVISPPFAMPAKPLH